MPRGLRAYPLVGHLPHFLPDKLGFLRRAAATLGDVAPLRLPGPTLLLGDPEDIRHVLVSRHANYVKTLRLTDARGRSLFGDGLLRSTGDAHRRRRLLLQPLFHQTSIASLADVVVESTERLAESWRPGAEIDASAALSRLAQTITIRSLFGELTEREVDRIAHAVDARRRYIEHAFLSPLPFRESLPTPVRRSHRRGSAELDSAIATAVARTRAGARENGDLISLLVYARGEDGAALQDRDVRDEVLTLSVTGFETLGDALAWTWYLLARNPDAHAQLVSELDAELAGRAVSVDDLPRLRYAQLVFSESLRLYPPTWLYIRVALAADELPSGAAVAAGTKLYLSPYVTHRDPRFFPDPERFDPSRFETSAVRARPKLAYFPFGSGPHVCIGEAFARMEAALVLAILARRFRPELAPGSTVEPKPGMTLTPGGPVRMIVRRV